MTAEPFAVSVRTRRSLWFPAAWGGALGAAALVVAALVGSTVDRALLVVFALLMGVTAAESLVRVRAGHLAFEIREDGLVVGSVGLVPWADVVAVRVDPGGRTVGVEVRRASAVWQALPQWRRLLASANRLVLAGGIAWPLRQLDRTLDEIVAALAAVPAAASVRVTLPKRMTAGA